MVIAPLKTRRKEQSLREFLGISKPANDRKATVRRFGKPEMLILRHSDQKRGSRRGARYGSTWTDMHKRGSQRLWQCYCKLGDNNRR